MLDIEILDITDNPEYEKLLIGCIFHRKKKIPLKLLYQTRRERNRYLESSIPKGFHMKVLFWKGDHVGMVEYGPPEASGLPITGENIVVMNCIWVQRRAQKNGFGKMLINNMRESENCAAGFATLALEKYWMMWMQKWMMENLGEFSSSSTDFFRKSIAFRTKLSNFLSGSELSCWSISFL